MTTAQTADLVADFIARGGTVTKCPTGKSALAIEYVWEEGKGLVMKDPAQLEQVKRRYARHGGQRKREETPAITERRRKLTLLMAECMSAAQCAAALGVNETTVRKDAKALDMTFERPKREAPKPRPSRAMAVSVRRQTVAERREKVAALLEQDKAPKDIAAALGFCARTIHQDCRALGATVQARQSTALREKIRAEYRPDRTTTEIAAIVGVNPSTARRHLSEMGLKARRHTGGQCPKETARRKSIVLSMVANGATGPEMAEAAGCHLSVVHDYCRKAGVRIKRKASYAPRKKAA